MNNEDFQSLVSRALPEQDNTSYVFATTLSHDNFANKSMHRLRVGTNILDIKVAPLEPFWSVWGRVEEEGGAL